MLEAAIKIGHGDKCGDGPVGNCIGLGMEMGLDWGKKL